MTQAEQNRENQWAEYFIGCSYHPWRKCNRWTFVFRRSRRCGTCKSNGTPAYHRYRKSARRLLIKQHHANPRGWIKRITGA